MKFLKLVQRVIGFAAAFSFLVGCSTPAVTPIPTQTPTRSPIPTTAPTNTAASENSWKTFSSRRYGYSIAYPADWLVTEKKGEWKSEKVLYPYDPGSDVFSARGASVDNVTVGAQPLTDTMTLDSWTATNIHLTRTQLGPCGDPETTEQTTLGGETATSLTYHCTDGYFLIWVLAVHDTKGYAVVWGSRTGNEADDRTTFARFVSGFAFTE